MLKRKLRRLAFDDRHYALMLAYHRAPKGMRLRRLRELQTYVEELLRWSFTVEIPVPPSINNAFLNNQRRGRIKTDRYRAWLDAAGWAIKATVAAESRVAGPFRISINLPRTMGGDIDNRVKAIVDALVASGRVDDDRNMEELHVRRRHDKQTALVHVKAGRPEEAA